MHELLRKQTTNLSSNQAIHVKSVSVHTQATIVALMDKIRHFASEFPSAKIPFPPTLYYVTLQEPYEGSHFHLLLYMHNKVKHVPKEYNQLNDSPLNILSKFPHQF